MKKLGKLFVVSSPSGGGKTTLGRMLLKRVPDVIRSVSMTTRKPRTGEKNRKDYYFTTREAFLSLKKTKGFLESATVFGQSYGTPKHFVEKNLEKGKDVLLLIDVQGAAQVRRRFPQSVLIFIMPPSLSVLKKRLRDRSTDNSVEINKRLRVAKQEMRKAKLYNYVIVNEDLKEASENLKAIVTAERCRVWLPKKR